jgi:hypothetical protein
VSLRQHPKTRIFSADIRDRHAGRVHLSALEQSDPAREGGREGYVYCNGVWRQTTAADLIALRLIAP